MRDGTTCPDAATLKKLACGDLTPSAVERLAEHCEQCEACVQALERAPSTDTFQDAMRAPTTVVESVLPERVERLIDAAKGFIGGEHRAAKHGAEETVSLSPGRSSELSVATPAENEAWRRLLAPAQGPDELGRIGTYRVIKVLGVGGMGVVFLVEDPELKRRLVLKTMKLGLAADPTARQRFLREARAMAAVQHEHVAHINQIDHDGAIPFLTMPYLDGETLEQRLQRQESLPPAEVVRIGAEIASGLAAAHARGLVHRDVKPSNIWLEAPRGRVKLLDFGLVRAAGHDRELTHPGAIPGTPAYMAPEQAQGANVDHRADLFSLDEMLP